MMKKTSIALFCSTFIFANSTKAEYSRDLATDVVHGWGAFCAELNKDLPNGAKTPNTIYCDLSDSAALQHGKNMLSSTDVSDLYKAGYGQASGVIFHKNAQQNPFNWVFEQFAEKFKNLQKQIDDGKAEHKKQIEVLTNKIEMLTTTVTNLNAAMKDNKTLQTAQKFGGKK
ncbi:MAG: hypothetical protein K2Y18_09830 [Alphaproteobacteria bacterium]|jgi:hypothetical protein|nr:hypothetical protein [Alphaproteobacteria bacterium]